MRKAFAGDVEFHKLLARRSDVDLVRLLLEFAADNFPQLDEVACIADLERLGDRARVRVAAIDALDLRERLASISELVYFDEGFHGNRKAYYDPRNSYLNEILERRTGIPISLGIIYLFVAARAGVSMYGVGTPGHFLLGARGEEETFYVDPFAAGEVLTRPEAIELIESILGQKGVLRDEHFRPATPREIAVRVLRNLKAAHAIDNEWDKALPIQSRLALLLPNKADEQRDLGLIYLRTGQPQPALALLERYIETCRADEAESLAPYIDSARKLAAESSG